MKLRQLLGLFSDVRWVVLLKEEWRKQIILCDEYIISDDEDLSLDVTSFKLEPRGTYNRLDVVITCARPGDAIIDVNVPVVTVRDVCLLLQRDNVSNVRFSQNGWTKKVSTTNFAYDSDYPESNKNVLSITIESGLFVLHIN